MKVNTNAPADASQALERARENQRSEKVDNRAGKSDVKSASPATTASTVEISENARLLQSAAETIRAQNDIDMDRVRDLKERIAAGNYRVDAERVADRLVDDHLLVHFGKNSL